MVYSSLDTFHLQELVSCDNKSDEQPQNNLTAFCTLNTDPSCSKHNVILKEPNSIDIPVYVETLI